MRGAERAASHSVVDMPARADIRSRPSQGHRLEAMTMQQKTYELQSRAREGLVLGACLALFASGARAQEAAPPAQDTAPTTPPVAAPAAPVAAPAPAPAPPPPPPPPVTQFAEKAAIERPKNDGTSLNASAGGSANSGNTRAYLLNAGLDFRWVRNPHGLGANVAFAYGRAKPPDAEDDDMLETVKNLNARARYDFFLTQTDGLFAQTAFRWDPFAGIERRNQFQLGYLRYFVVEEKHRLWGELGYDLTIDSLTGVNDAPPPAEPNPVLHSARVFAGYENQLNEAVTFVGGVEFLLNVERPGKPRLNLDAALRSALAGNLKIELKFRLAYDAAAYADRGAENVDTITLVSLLYTLI
jgi:putative salt-induced outer membrane protein YdiY